MLRGGVDQVIQIGVETTPGTAVAANRFLPTLSVNLKREIETKSFRARGSKLNTSKTIGKRMAKGDYEGVLDYNSIIYVLASLFPYAAPVAQGASGGYLWTFTPGVRSSDAARKTYTTEIGDAVGGERYAFTQLTSFGMEANQDDFSIKGNAIARYPTDNVTMTASPTARAERPVDRDDVDLFMDSSFGALGTTKVTEALAESMDLGEKFAEVFFHNRTAGQFANIIEKPYEAKFSFETGHNAQSRTLLAEIINNPWKYIRWEAYGNLIGMNGAAEVVELIRMDMSVKFDSPERMGDPDAPYAYKYNTEIMPDGTNAPLTISVINSLSGL